MATYAIGDLQGCLEPLKRLLDFIQYNPLEDHLIFAGDLVNRGPDSLATLEFVRSLPSTTVVFGNHDLHTIACFYDYQTPSRQDTLSEFVNAPELEPLISWWRHKGVMLHRDEAFDVVVTHAGVPPEWDLQTLQKVADEVTDMIRTDEVWFEFLPHMYGNTPELWSKAKSLHETYRFAINALTRMRLVDQNNALELKTKTPLHLTPKDLSPWFEKRHPSFETSSTKVLFGHWAALEGQCPAQNCVALDSGCVWGGKLAAYRLDDEKRFEVDGLAK